MPKKGYKQTEEHRKKTILNHRDISGDKNPMWGIHIPRSEEIKRKISKSHMGMFHSEETRKKMSENHIDYSGDKNPNFGKRASEEIKKKISIKLKGKFLGEKSPNWNPNITDEERLIKRKYPEYKLWHKEVLERDHFTCIKCGDDRGGNLEAHHIESYANNKGLRTTVLNGATLCVPCHKDFHRQYGIESTAEKFAEFLK